MKKIWTCVLTLALAAAVACGGGGTDSAGGDAAPANGGEAAAEAPADGGETASAEGEKMNDHPWANAQVGDWAKYSMPGATMTWTVTAVSDTEVTYDAVTEAAGMTMPAQSMTIPLVVEAPADAPEVEAPPMETSEATVDAAGTSWNCTVTKVEMAGAVSETYMSKDMPLGGLIKQVTNGDVSMELVEWGRGGGEAAAEEAPAA